MNNVRDDVISKCKIAFPFDKDETKIERLNLKVVNEGKKT